LLRQKQNLKFVEEEENLGVKKEQVEPVLDHYVLLYLLEGVLYLDQSLA
jgi:hypothetical protein